LDHDEHERGRTKRHANAPVRRLVFRWRTPDDDKRDAEYAEAERLRDEGKLIEHEAGPQPSNKD
jgi:hypothetical protein